MIEMRPRAHKPYHTALPRSHSARTPVSMLLRFDAFARCCVAIIAAAAVAAIDIEPCVPGALARVEAPPGGSALASWTATSGFSDEKSPLLPLSRLMVAAAAGPRCSYTMRIHGAPRSQDALAATAGAQASARNT